MKKIITQSEILHMSNNARRMLALEIATQTHRTALCWTQMDKQDKSMLMDFMSVALEVK